MIVGVDIGNTNIVMAAMDKRGIRRRQRVPTHASRPEQQAKMREFCQDLRSLDAVPGTILICSVVPRRTAVVAKIFKDAVGVRGQIVGRDVLVPIRNRYRDPAQVGQDRLVGAYAAQVLYGCPAIIVDVGTAITLDVVSSRGEYRGGIIVPGLDLSADVLFRKTALLPRVDIHQPPELIGRDTEGSILSGMFYGYAEMIGGLILRLKRRLRSRPVVVLTGGRAVLLQRYVTEKVDVLDPDLVMRGLALLYEQARKW